MQGVRIRASHKWKMTVLQIVHGTGRNRIPKQLSEPGIVEATIPAWMLHLTLCMAVLKFAALPLTRPSFSFSLGRPHIFQIFLQVDHLITPCWLGMVQMVSAVVEARDVSQLRVIQRPHNVGVPYLELRPPGFATPSCLELLRGSDAMLAVNYHELANLDSIPRGWRLSQEPIVLVH